VPGAALSSRSKQAVIFGSFEQRLTKTAVDQSRWHRGENQPTVWFFPRSALGPLGTWPLSARKLRTRTTQIPATSCPKNQRVKGYALDYL